MMKKVLFVIMVAFAIAGCNKDKQATQREAMTHADSLREQYRVMSDSVVSYSIPPRKVENYLIVHVTDTDTLAQNGKIQFIAYDATWDGDTTLVNRWRIDLMVVDNRIILKGNLISLTPLK